MSRKIYVFDTTLRDGEQVPGAKLNLNEKLEVAEQIAKMKVDMMEVGFPSSSQGDFEAVQAISRKIGKDVWIAALGRAVQADIDCIYESIREAENPLIHIVLGSSDVHVAKKFRKTPEQVIEMGVGAVKYASSLLPQVQYSLEDASRSEFEYLWQTIEAVVKAGATIINVPDTVGFAIPEQFGKLIYRINDRLKNLDPQVMLSVHCHNDTGLATGFEVEGDFPKYGNDDDRADEIGVWLLRTFLEMIKKRHTYRNSEATTSILTITSNVVYGKYTGALPDGRAAFTPFAPGANPSYGAEQNGLLASLNSVAKLPYHWALDGISNTQTINPDALGHSEGERVENLVQVMDGYFDQGAHHLNVNVFGKEKLLDAMEHPEKEEYANFTIRVSGYAVKFIDLTREQQMDVISRTCHAAL